MGFCCGAVFGTMVPHACRANLVTPQISEPPVRFAMLSSNARFGFNERNSAAAGSDAHVLPGIGTAINRIPAFDGPEEFLLAMRQSEILRRPKSLLYLQGLKWVQSVAR